MTSRKPEHLKLISGTARPDRAARAPIVELTPLAEVPTAPAFLPNGHAVAEWRRLAPVLTANNLLHAGNLHALALLCGLHGRIVQLWAAGEAPQAAVVGQIRALLADLGLSGMRLPPAPPGPRNRFSLHGRKSTEKGKP
jgi:hypothetical protein